MLDCGIQECWQKYNIKIRIILSVKTILEWDKLSRSRQRYNQEDNMKKAPIIILSEITTRTWDSEYWRSIAANLYCGHDCSLHICAKSLNWALIYNVWPRQSVYLENINISSVFPPSLITDSCFIATNRFYKSNKLNIWQAVNATTVLKICHDKHPSTQTNSRLPHPPPSVF